MNHQWKEIEPKMIGLWEMALTTLTSIDNKCFNGKHQPCPNCMGSDRFRFDNERHEKGDGGAICSQCGSGNGMHWLTKLTGWSFADSVNALGDYLNLTPPEKIEISKKNIQTFKAVSSCSATITTEQVQSVMDKTVEYPCHIYPMSQGIGPDNLRVINKERTNAKGDKEVIDSRIAVPVGIPGEFPQQGKQVSLELCNVVMIDQVGDVSYVAGRTKDNPSGMASFGAVAVIGANTGKSIYLCSEWADAWHTHYLTGAQVWCCFGSANMEMVANKYKEQCDNGSLRMAVNYDFNELCEAENANCKVIIPASRGRINDGKGFEKKIFDAGALLDEMKKPA